MAAESARVAGPHESDDPGGHESKRQLGRSLDARRVVQRARRVRGAVLGARAVSGRPRAVQQRRAGRKPALSTPAWAGPGAPKIVLQGSLDSVTLAPTKVAGIIVVVKELLKLGRPGSAEFLRDMLSRALAAYIDEQFVDPAVTGVTDESPASITFGVSPVAVTGDADVDIANLVAAYVAGGARLETAAFLLSSENAIALRLLGGDIFRDLTVSGGLLAGVPAYASSSVGDRMSCWRIARRSLVADDGGGRVDATENAAIEQRDDPTQSGSEAGSPDAPVGASMTSTWQLNMVAIRLERFINWQALDGAVAFLDNVYLTIAGSPA